MPRRQQCRGTGEEAMAGNSKPCLCPPHPDVAARHFREYERRGRDFGLSFPQYQTALGLVHVDEAVLPRGVEIPTEMCCCPTPALASHFGSAELSSPASITTTGTQSVVPPPMSHVTPVLVSGEVKLIILLVDFNDKEESTDKSYYEDIFFSKGSLPRGSVADYYDVCSIGHVSIGGEVHGWYRMPEDYSYYTDGAAGLGEYPSNCQKLVEDAVQAAREGGLVFTQDLDFRKDGSVNGLVIVHAGEGSELLHGRVEQLNNIWSHCWAVPRPLSVSNTLSVQKYSIVNEGCSVGVCAHEVGHLVFGWDDFYDIGGSQGGKYWDGSRTWDLMGSGCWNGKNADCPALPAILHRVEQNWVQVEEVCSTVRKLTIPPHSRTSSMVVKIVSPVYESQQFLLLETRSVKKGTMYDSTLHGEGLLVWKVDLNQERGLVVGESENPRMRLVEADGRGSLLGSSDHTQGDCGDTFPGSTKRTTLDDNLGLISTSFAGGPAGGVELQNISYNGKNGSVTLDIVFVDVVGSIGTMEKVVVPKQISLEKQVSSGGGNGGALAGNDVAVDVHVETLESKTELQIPNKNPVGILSRVRIGTVGIVAGVEMEATISHRRSADLHIEIVSPQGKPVKIYHHGHVAMGGSVASTSITADQFKLSISDPHDIVFKPLIGVQASGMWGLRVCDTRGGRGDGRLKSWRIAVTVVGSTRQMSETALAKATILEGVGFASSIDVPKRGHVKEVGIEIGISHTVATHIHAELMAPSGEIVLLSGKLVNGKSGSMLLAADSANDLQLAPMIGTSIYGSWTLRLTDILGEGTSTLDAWNLKIEYVPLLPVKPSALSLADGVQQDTMFSSLAP